MAETLFSTLWSSYRCTGFHLQLAPQGGPVLLMWLPGKENIYDKHKEHIVPKIFFQKFTSLFSPV